jgi:hypothetical protein
MQTLAGELGFPGLWPEHLFNCLGPTASVFFPVLITVVVLMKMVPFIGRSTIRRCGLVGIGVVLEETSHWGWALRFQKFKPDPTAHVLFLLPDVDLSGPF